MKAELQRRESLASKLAAYLKARPGVWVPIHTNWRPSVGWGVGEHA